MRAIPNRPAISNVLIKASANGAFRAKLLTSPQEALLGMNVPPEDFEILTSIQAASTFQDYVRQIKMRLLAQRI